MGNDISDAIDSYNSEGPSMRSGLDFAEKSTQIDLSRNVKAYVKDKCSSDSLPSIPYGFYTANKLLVKKAMCYIYCFNLNICVI